MNCKIMLIFSAAAFLLLGSCAKEGPQGIPGPSGDPGTPGPAGPSGIPGSQVYSGTTAPLASLGINGDFYLDKSTGNLYGPKTGMDWGAPIALGGSGGKGPAGPQGPAGPAGPQGATGATGAAGAAGSQIYSGAGAPPAGTGKTGDYYIDTEHAAIFGPKTASGWPATGLSLQVNTTITYEFDNKLQYNLPYSWRPINQNAAAIWLPYNNAAAQTQGFTIPQDIIDHGIVLSYIRYFKFGYANDTATSFSMSPWWQMPYSITFTSGNFNTFNISTMIADNGFQIQINGLTAVSNFTLDSIPAVIRIVLIPEGKVTALQKANPDLRKLTMDQLENAIMEAGDTRRPISQSPSMIVSQY